MGSHFSLFASYVWHYAPWTLWVIAGMSVAIDEVVRRGRRAVAGIAVALVLVGFVAAVPLRPRDVDRSREQYPAIAQWIDHDSTKPHPTVAIIEIGQLG